MAHETDDQRAATPYFLGDLQDVKKGTPTVDKTKLLYNLSNTQYELVAPSANIPDLAAITGGEAPTEAEHNLVVAKVNAIIAALEAQGVTVAG